MKNGRLAMTHAPAAVGDRMTPGRHGLPPGPGGVRIGISACLLGASVRFDGGHKLDRFLAGTVGPLVEWVPVCPEVEAGLGTPREAVRLVGTDERPRLVGRSGADHTDLMARTVDRLVGGLAGAGLDGFVFKKSSPSCGLFRVPVHPPAGGRPVPGQGLFAAGLTGRFPDLPVEEEGRLQDAGLREAFFEAAYAHHRLRRFVEDGPTPAGLVELHARHKMTLLAHDPDGYRALGRLVARAGAGDFPAVVDGYITRFMAAVRAPATRGRHANVLQHLFGLVTDRLDRPRRQEFVEVVDDYRTGLVPLAVPVTLLRHHLAAGDAPGWATAQTYLEPYPKQLRLRNLV